jgi:hypothetical protein
MKQVLSGKTLVPLSATIAILTTFGMISFKVGTFYYQATNDSESVKQLNRDVAQIKEDVGIIKTKINLLTPPEVSLIGTDTRDETNPFRPRFKRGR